MRKLMFVILFCAFALFSAQEVVAQFSINGQVVDNNQTPITGVNCIILSIPDSSQLAGTTTNKQGFFELKVKENKEYILYLSFIGYEKSFKTCRPGNLGVLILAEDTLLLDEIVVTPQVLNTFGSQDHITLSQSAKKVGNNALDAIGSLPQFKTNTTNGELMTVDNKSILVLIDGMRRSSRDLILLQSKDIKSIVFYSNPPARYAHENIGAVIDVKTKKKIDRLFTFYLDTKNSVTTGYGTDMLSMAYMDSLNMLSAAYFIDYRAMNEVRMNNKYSYIAQNKVNEFKGSPGKYTGQYHIGQLSYQRYQRNDLFNAKVEFRQSPGKHKYDQMFVSQIDTLQNIINSRNFKSDYSAASADLYYMHMFNQYRNFSINVVNTFFKSTSNNNLSSDGKSIRLRIISTINRTQ